MEIAAAASFSPLQGAFLQPSATAVQRPVAKPRDEVATSRQEVATQREPLDPRRESAREARRPAASEAAPPAGFQFEYQENTRVMKVNDSKGVLIYQVPSKGQLALLKAADTASQVETTA